MSIFLNFQKNRGYTGYRGYKPKKACIYKGFSLPDLLNHLGLQRVTRGYSYYLYYFCNPCNPEQKFGVTVSSPVKSLDLSRFFAAVTRVTPVTPQKYKVKQINIIDEAMAEMMDRLNPLLLFSHAQKICVCSLILFVTLFSNFSLPCAPLCPRALIARKTQRGAAFHRSTHQ